jgi:hypothetical protein
MAGNHPLSKINGLKGGRPVGSKSKPQLPQEVKEAILERYRERGVELADEMLEIAFNKKNFAPTRITAIDKIFDRALGRAPQPIDGDGQGGAILLQVITGVPRRNIQDQDV